MIRYYLRRTDWNLERATIGASGFDLRYDGEMERELSPGTRWLAPTGLFLEMPRGVEAQVRARSGLALNFGVIVLNAPGTIDSDYRGEVGATLINLGQQSWMLRPGERIAQIVFAPVFAQGFGKPIDAEDLTMVCTSYGEILRVPGRGDLSETTRGEGGHGSTGR